MKSWSVIRSVASACATALVAELAAAFQALPTQVVAPHAPVFVTAHDTINGSPIADPHLVARIERIAAALPPPLLALHSRLPSIRYVAQGFGRGDDAPVFSAVFRHPAAALAFGCALDDEPSYPCELVPATVGPEPYEEIPGVRCVPMRLAVGAPAFEPDRCEASG